MPGPSLEVQVCIWYDNFLQLATAGLSISHHSPEVWLTGYALILKRSGLAALFLPLYMTGTPCCPGLSPGGGKSKPALICSDAGIPHPGPMPVSGGGSL